MRIRQTVAIAAAGLSAVLMGLPAYALAPWTVPESDFGGAAPINPREWITFQDYPNAAIRENEEGYVVVTFTINTEGRVADCVVSRSSGFARLDAVPCRLLEKRARFEPATDANGAPRATTATTAISFWSP